MKKMVLTYWLCPEEESEFIDFLASTGDVVAFTVDWKVNAEEVQPNDLRVLIAKANPAQVMIGLRNGYRLIEKHAFEGRIRYNVSAHCSALLIYQRGRLLGKELAQSNMAAYHGVAGRPSQEDQIFYKWCRKVFRWVRVRTPEKDPSGNYRISPVASAAARRGDLSLHF